MVEIIQKSKYLLSALLTVAILCPFYSFAYIIPASQIIEFMTNKYSAVKTLKIIQINRIVGINQEYGNSIENIIYVMFPDLYRSEISGPLHKRIQINNGDCRLSVVDGMINDSEDTADFPYHFLFIAQNHQETLNYFKDLGINVEKTSLTRYAGKISYLIGDRENESPKLIVDKELFLPLLLKYHDSLFIFSDYKDMMEKDLYPYKVVHLHNGIKEEYSVKGIMVNPPLDLYLFEIPIIRDRFNKKVSE